MASPRNAAESSIGPETASLLKMRSIEDLSRGYRAAGLLLLLLLLLQVLAALC